MKKRNEDKKKTDITVSPTKPFLENLNKNHNKKQSLANEATTDTTKNLTNKATDLSNINVS